MSLISKKKRKVIVNKAIENFEEYDVICRGDFSCCVLEEAADFGLIGRNIILEYREFFVDATRKFGNCFYQNGYPMRNIQSLNTQRILMLALFAEIGLEGIK